MSTIAINPIHRAVRFYEAPIGKKAVMAVTGVMLFGYVVAHLLGNLQIYSANPRADQPLRRLSAQPFQCGAAVAARTVPAGGGRRCTSWPRSSSGSMNSATPAQLAYVKKADVPAAPTPPAR